MEHHQLELEPQARRVATKPKVQALSLSLSLIEEQEEESKLRSWEFSAETLTLCLCYGIHFRFSYSPLLWWVSYLHSGHFMEEISMFMPKHERESIPVILFNKHLFVEMCINFVHLDDSENLHTELNCSWQQLVGYVEFLSLQLRKQSDESLIEVIGMLSYWNIDKLNVWTRIVWSSCTIWLLF